MLINFEEKISQVNAQLDQYQRQPKAELLCAAHQEFARLIPFAETPSDILKLQATVSRFSEIADSRDQDVNDLISRIRQACNLQSRENPSR